LKSPHKRLTIVRIFSDHFSTRELRELTKIMLCRKDEIRMTKLGGMANDQRRRITKPLLLCPDYQRLIPVDSRAAHSSVRAWPVAETTGNR